eukprot:SAG11_NODE_2549_length_3231_cov_3.053640_1_plen_231_part_00
MSDALLQNLNARYFGETALRIMNESVVDDETPLPPGYRPTLTVLGYIHSTKDSADFLYPADQKILCENTAESVQSSCVGSKCSVLNSVPCMHGPLHSVQCGCAAAARRSDKNSGSGVRRDLACVGAHYRWNRQELHTLPRGHVRFAYPTASVALPTRWPATCFSTALPRECAMCCNIANAIRGWVVRHSADKILEMMRWLQTELPHGLDAWKAVDALLSDAALIRTLEAA